MILRIVRRRAKRLVFPRCLVRVCIAAGLVLESVAWSQQPSTGQAVKAAAKPANQPPAGQANAPKPPAPGSAQPAPGSTPVNPQGPLAPGAAAATPASPDPATPPPAAINPAPAAGSSIEQQLRSVAMAQRSAQAGSLAQQVASTRQQMALARDSFWSTPLEPSVPAAADSISPPTATPEPQSDQTAAHKAKPETPELAQVPPVPSPQASSRAGVLPQAMAMVRRQLDSFDDFFTLNWDAPGPITMPNVRVPTADCPPMEDAEIDKIIKTAAGHNDVAPELIKAVVRQESAFHPCSVSTAGAMGLMQLMPATAEAFAVSDPFAPEQNVEAGAKYLKQLIERYHGDVRLALGAYNAGAGRVDQTGDIPAIPETMDYVRRIMDSLPNQ